MTVSQQQCPEKFPSVQTKMEIQAAEILLKNMLNGFLDLSILSKSLKSADSVLFDGRKGTGGFS